MLKKHLFLLGFVAWMAFVTSLSLATFTSDHQSYIQIPHLDKVAHFTFYFIAVILGCFFLREQRSPRMTMVKAIVIMAVGLSFYGIILEVIQDRFTEQRTMELFDALSNMLGAFAGGVVVKFLFSGKRQLKW